MQTLIHSTDNQAKGEANMQTYYLHIYRLPKHHAQGAYELVISASQDISNSVAILNTYYHETKASAKAQAKCFVKRGNANYVSHNF